MITYENYAAIRDSKKLRDADIAKAAGIPQSTFSDWKKGKSRPKQEKMIRIAEALGMAYQEFVGPVGKFSAYRLSDDTQKSLDKLHETLEKHKPAFEELERIRASLPKIDSELLELYHNATADAQTSVMTLLRNSQIDSKKEGSKSSKGA